MIASAYPGIADSEFDGTCTSFVAQNLAQLSITQAFRVALAHQCPLILYLIIILFPLNLHKWMCRTADTVPVAWSWGGGAPSGKVANKKEEGEIAIQSKRGNTIKKNADPENPAVHISRSGNDVVKRASELEIKEKGSGNKGQQNGESKKRENEDGEHGEPEQKKAKKDDEAPAEKKGRGRPKKAEEDKKPAANKTSAAGKNGEEKKGRGRPKGKVGTGASATKKKQEKKPSKPRNTEGVSGRTRSRA